MDSILDDQNKVLLPNQAKFFGNENLKKRNRRSGTLLPNPEIEPYGYSPEYAFSHLFPELNLPSLEPPKALHPEDGVSFGYPEMPINKLYFGDNLYVMRSLPSESIDLIYIDPPFFSNREYVMIWGEDNEVRSFNDIFADGMYSYLAWLNARLWEMKRLLKPTGSIYVHCDWHASHYIKTEMDRIFGYDNFLDEIIWYKGFRGTEQKNRFQHSHDIVFSYQKQTEPIWNQIYGEYRDPKMSRYNKVDENGNRYALIKRVKTDGTVYYGKTYPQGKKSNDVLKIPDLPENFDSEDILFDIVDIPILAATDSERIGYPTQKPEELLRKLIIARSNEGDTVADFFMGGGTTGAVALKLGRNFIGSDISRVAVSVTMNRLVDAGEEITGKVVRQKKEVHQDSLDMIDKQVGDIQIGYVGNYPIDKFEGINQDEFEKVMLKMYGASVFTGQAENIHGTANGKIIISVGPASPSQRVSGDQVKKAFVDVAKHYASELKNGAEKELHILGWSFEPLMDKVVAQLSELANKQGFNLRTKLITIASEDFRNRVFKNVGESNIDLSTNRLSELLSFTSSPVAGQINIQALGDFKFKFELVGARSTGVGGRLVNTQWDFDFRNNCFADKQHCLNREKVGKDWQATLIIEFNFDKEAEFIVGSKVQDSFGGEAIVTLKILVKKGSYEILK